jgi:hypothetical protein
MRKLTEFGRIRSVSGVKAGSWRGLVNSTLVYAFELAFMHMEFINACAMLRAAR